MTLLNEFILRVELDEEESSVRLSAAQIEYLLQNLRDSCIRFSDSMTEIISDYHSVKLTVTVEN